MNRIEYEEALRGYYYNYPRIARSYLNEMSYQNKRKLPLSAKQKFITRNKSLFRSHSLFGRAKGRNINTMQAVMGLRKDKRISASLKIQEFGGINPFARKLFPTEGARITNSHQRRIRRKNYFKNNILPSKEYKGGVKNIRARKSTQSKFVARAIVAKQNKKLLKTRDGRYYTVDKLNLGRDKNVIKTTMVYVDKNKRTQHKKNSYNLHAVDTHVLKQAQKIWYDKSTHYINYHMRKYGKL